MEQTILQSESWHCRKNAWHSSFIMLIGEINSHLCFPWLPSISQGCCCVAKPSKFTMPAYMQAEQSSGQCCYHSEAFIVLIFFLEKKKIGHYVSLGVSQPLLQYLSDLLEGSVALWKKWSRQRGEKKIGFSESCPSLGSMQCLNHLLHLSIKVLLSVH